jgi:predicted dehydrogenase
VPKHAHTPMEIYGTRASMLVPDPNKFGGEVRLAQPRAPEWEQIEASEAYTEGNYRSLGLADMAYAILIDRPHRASGELALHVLEVMEAFEKSTQLGGFVEIGTRVERPSLLSTDVKTTGSAKALAQ